MTPKATIKQDKKDKVEVLKQALESAKSAVFVDYKGMDVSMVSDFRAQISEAGGKMTVAKNTLIKIAARDAGYPEEALTDEVLAGQTAVIFGNEDAVSPIQILGKFSEERELPQIRAGVVENVFQNKEGIIKISKLPTKEELQAKVVGGLISPLYGLVGTLNGNLQSLVMTLNSIKEQKSA